jgi:hypothetical protein
MAPLRLPAKPMTDLGAWHDYFHAAIAGIVSAHRRAPNPDLVVRIGASIASRALEEYQAKRLEGKR